MSNTDNLHDREPLTNHDMRAHLLYKIERPIYSFENLKTDFIEDDLSQPLLKAMREKARNIRIISIRSVLFRFFPLAFILQSFYTISCLFYDLIAGITMLVFHIPQGMAYGILAGLEPINGLYASFFPPLIYCLFGTSRHLSMGTFSIMALLSSVPVMREVNMSVLYIDYNSTGNGSTEMPFVGGQDDSRLQISVATTLLAGLIQLGMGLSQMGCVMNFVNDALIGGFITATAFHVIVSQTSQLLGYSIRRYSGIGELPYKLYLYCINIRNTHLITIGISCSCIVILILFTEFLNPKIQKKFKFPFPIQLVVVIVATIISYYCSFSRKYSVKIVGPIPKGFPKPFIPDIMIWPKVFIDAILLAIVGFVVNSSLVKIYSLKFSYDVDYNQEFLAYGLSNIFGSFFQCTIAAGALARSSVVVQVGMKSQLASLISCILMVFVLLFIGPLFEHVPTAALSAIIVVSLKSMIMQLGDLPQLYYLSKYDFNVWVVSFLATMFLNVPFGLVAGFLFSLLTIVIRLQNPKSQILGQLPNTDIYKSLKIFKVAKEIAGVKIFRYDAPLYFANAEHFQSKLYKKSGINPRKMKISKTHEKVDNKKNENDSVTLRFRDNNVEDEEQMKEKLTETNEDIRFIIIDVSSVNYVDNVAIRILEDIYNSYRSIDIHFFLAGPNNKIRKILKKAKFAKENLDRIMFVTIHDAVLSTYRYKDEIQ